MSFLIVGSLLFTWIGRWRQSLVDLKGLARYHLVYDYWHEVHYRKHAMSMHTCIHLFSSPKLHYAWKTTEMSTANVKWPAKASL